MCSPSKESTPGHMERCNSPTPLPLNRLPHMKSAILMQLPVQILPCGDKPLLSLSPVQSVGKEEGKSPIRILLRRCWAPAKVLDQAAPVQGCEDALERAGMLKSRKKQPSGQKPG